MQDSVSSERQRPVVLVIDDNEHILTAIDAMLGRSYTVHTCREPEGASAMVEALQPDAVVLDIRMPRHDGFWVYEEIRKSDKAVPIIVNTAYQDAIDPQEVWIYEPFAYLAKGSNIGTFLRTVAAAVGYKSLCAGR